MSDKTSRRASPDKSAPVRKPDAAAARPPARGNARELQGRYGNAAIAAHLSRLAGDRAEQDADDAAERVMRGRAPSARPATPAPGEPIAPDLARAIEASRGGGEPLSASSRAFFEPRLGRDLGGVRIHADAAAAESARALDARAYTVGRDVYFDAGQYDPSTDRGRRLLAHELAHVAQQQHAPRALVQRKRHEPQASEPESRQSSFDLTGRYEARESRDGRRISLQLNHAGRQLVGWLRVTGYSPGLERRVEGGEYHILGSLVRDARDTLVFHYQKLPTSEGGPVYDGNLAATLDHGAVEITMWGEDDRATFQRVSTEPRAGEAVIEGVQGPGRAAVVTGERAPLEPAAEERVNRGVTAVKSFISQYLDEGDAAMRSSIAGQLDEALDRMFHELAQSQQSLIEDRLRTSLLGAVLRHKYVTRPYWDWLRFVVTAEAAYTKVAQTQLDIHSDAKPDDPDKKPLNHYHWQLRAIGPSADVVVGASAMWCELKVTKTAPDRWGPHVYNGLLGSVSAGVSVGVQVGFRTENDVDTPFDWRPSNFIGSFKLLGSGGGGAVGGGGTKGVGSITFDGDGTFPKLIGDAGGDTDVIGAWLGAEGSETVGKVFGSKATKKEETLRSEPVRTKPTEAKSVFADRLGVHFLVDDAVLTSGGRSEIEALCAEHRLALGDPKTVLSIDAHTSTTATEEHDLRLSKFRAINALQAIRDALGASFKVPRENQHVEWHGEAVARAAGVPDKTETARWRRVDIRINGTLVLTLH